MKKQNHLEEKLTHVVTIPRYTDVSDNLFTIHFKNQLNHENKHERSHLKLDICFSISKDRLIPKTANFVFLFDFD